MSDEGYIKSFRTLISWEWFTDVTTAHLYVYLLHAVNWKPGKWKGYEILPGQMITSVDKLAKATGLSIQQVRTGLTKLISTSNITKTSTNKYTLITVVNWAKFQCGDETATSTSTSKATNEQQTNNKQTTNKQQTNNNNRRKKEEEEGKKERIKTVALEGIVEYYNSTCPYLPKVEKLTDARKRAIKARIAEYSEGGEVELGKRAVKQAIDNMAASSWHNGTGEWKGGSFDWLFKPGNFSKMHELNSRREQKKEQKPKYRTPAIEAAMQMLEAGGENI